MEDSTALGVIWRRAELHLHPEGLSRAQRLDLLTGRCSPQDLANLPGSLERSAQGWMDAPPTPEDLELVYTEFHRRGTAFLRSRGAPPQVAEDGVADAMESTCRKAQRGEIRARGALYNYFMISVLNAYRRTLRSPERPLALASSLELEEGEAPRIGEEEPPVAKGVVRRCVQDLRACYRHLITQHYWLKIPLKELARGEGLTKGAISHRHAKALFLLYRCLLSRGLDRELNPNPTLKALRTLLSLGGATG